MTNIVNNNPFTPASIPLFPSSLISSDKKTLMIITPNDKCYPETLKNIDAPPSQLFIAGNVHCLFQPCLAIVGTRKPSHFASKLTENWAKILSDAGLVIVSGLALGIDGAAHIGALEGKSKTIAVVGCGLDYDYPKQHRDLKKAIIEKGGCIISEHPPGTPPIAAHFPKRNRLISGLSEGVLVMEAALRSGSLVTARIAIEQGKEVMAVPGNIHNPMTQGCHWLIREGAHLVTSIKEISECLKTTINSIVITDPTQTNELSYLSKKEQFLLRFIADYITPMDQIIENSELDFTEICTILLNLEISGHVEKVVGGYVRK